MKSIFSHVLSERGENISRFQFTEVSMKKNDMNRRQFLQSAAMASAGLSMAARKEILASPGNLAAASPNDRITVGMIGVGARAQELMRAIQQVPGTEIVAVCAVDKSRLDTA